MRKPRDEQEQGTATTLEQEIERKEKAYWNLNPELPSRNGIREGETVHYGRCCQKQSMSGRNALNSPFLPFPHTSSSTGHSQWLTLKQNQEAVEPGENRLQERVGKDLRVSRK